MKAPPIDNRANVELIRFLADELRVAPSRLRLVNGQRGRNKLIAIDVPSETVEAWLASLGC